jgi:diguanylate cyclase (GGDEF)-like protein
MTIRGVGQQRLSVEVYAVPVIGHLGKLCGATLLLRDASSQIHLEKRVESLHVQATRDPLTGISNRAEFDRAHAEFVAKSQKSGRPCALIICDIDHFKLVNDTYGHQAGDHVLIRFASILGRSCRQGDMVARYGGEEFVILCADCDNATVSMRAEAIRRELESTPQTCLEHRPITASFGVTEIQAGDTPEIMLRRADRALLRAKGTGRNRVVQLGSGTLSYDKEKPPGRWRRWLQPPPSQRLLAETLVTAAPLAVTMEKLRGFVSDHHAEIIATEDGKLQLQVTKQAVACQSTTERPVSFLVTLQFLERKAEHKPRANSSQTVIHVTIRLANNRDRRRGNAYERAHHLFTSLKSYFMAQTYSGVFDPREAHANPTLFRRLLTMLHLRSGNPAER